MRPVERLEYEKKWRAKNREKLNAYMRARRAAHRLSNPLKPRLTEEEKAARRKACRASWYEANKEKHRADDAKWRERNKEKVAAYSKRYAQENREIVLRASAKYRNANKAYYGAKTMERNARKRQAAPEWANKFFIEEAYALAKLRTKMFGYQWHVDHIVPLMSPIVCGLHVEHNLQVIPGRANQSKSNHYWPDMP